MGYTDEEIIKMMNMHKSGEHGSIEDGIYINEEKICFHKVVLFEGKMDIMLPDKFEDMPLRLAKSKYPMEQRPQIIKTNEDTKINFTFSLIEQSLTNEQVNQMIKLFKQVLRNAKPDIKFIEEKTEKVDTLTVGWFDFVSNGYDQKIYNFMYFVPIAGKMMHGIFNCPVQDADSWKPVVLQVIKTIRKIG